MTLLSSKGRGTIVASDLFRCPRNNTNFFIRYDLGVSPSTKLRGLFGTHLRTPFTDLNRPSTRLLLSITTIRADAASNRVPKSTMKRRTDDQSPLLDLANHVILTATAPSKRPFRRIIPLTAKVWRAAKESAITTIDSTVKLARKMSRKSGA